MEQMQPCSSSSTGKSAGNTGNGEKDSATTANTSRTEETNRNRTENLEYLNHLDGYNLRHDPRYQVLCRNRCKRTTFQPCVTLSMPTKEEKIRKQLSELLEYDFERRLPLRSSNSFEDLARGFGSPF